MPAGQEPGQKQGESLFLRRPLTPEDWAAYHDIRRRAIFEPFAPGLDYDPDHPDERKAGNHPMVLVSGITVVGTLRIDLVDETRAALRLVGISPERQGQGLGRHLIDLAETFIRAHRRKRIVLHANPATVAFYKRLGYVESAWAGDQGLDGTHVDLAKDL